MAVLQWQIPLVGAGNWSDVSNWIDIATSSPPSSLGAGDTYIVQIGGVLTNGINLNAANLGHVYIETRGADINVSLASYNAKSIIFGNKFGGGCPLNLTQAATVIAMDGTHSAVSPNYGMPIAINGSLSSTSGNLISTLKFTLGGSTQHILPSSGQMDCVIEVLSGSRAILKSNPEEATIWSSTYLPGGSALPLSNPNRLHNSLRIHQLLLPTNTTQPTAGGNESALLHTEGIEYQQYTLEVGYGLTSSLGIVSTNNAVLNLTGIKVVFWCASTFTLPCDNLNTQSGMVQNTNPDSCTTVLLEDVELKLDEATNKCIVKSELTFRAVSLTIGAGIFLMGQGGETDSAHIELIQKPTIRGTWNFEEQTDGFYKVMDKAPTTSTIHATHCHAHILKEIRVDGYIKVKERATAPNSVAGFGMFWVHNAAPNTPMFTDDAGTTHNLLSGGGGGGGMTSFDVAGTAGSAQTITDGNTLTIAAGAGITTTASATDTVTVASTITQYTDPMAIAAVEGEATLDLTGDVTLANKKLIVDTNTLVVNAPSYTDKVGIGTATPTNPLHVKNTATLTDAAYVARFQSAEGNVGITRYGGIHIDNDNNSPFDGADWSESRWQISMRDTYQLDFAYGAPANTNVGAGSTGFRIMHTGNVGIGLGSSNPSQKLHVSGTIRQTNATNAIVHADANGDLGALTVGSGLSLSGSTLSATGGGGGSSGVTVQDEGVALATTATTLNFVGSSVVASGTGATKTITIGGGAPLFKHDENPTSSRFNPHRLLVNNDNIQLGNALGSGKDVSVFTPEHTETGNLQKFQIDAVGLATINTGREYIFYGQNSARRARGDDVVYEFDNGAIVSAGGAPCFFITSMAEVRLPASGSNFSFIINHQLRINEMAEWSGNVSFLPPNTVRVVDAGQFSLLNPTLDEENPITHRLFLIDSYCHDATNRRPNLELGKNF